MLATRITTLALCLLLLCSCTRSQEDALEELQARRIPFTEKVFLNYLLQGDSEIVELFIDAGVDPNLKVDVREAGYPTTAAVYQEVSKIPILLITLEKQQAEIEKILLNAGANKEDALAIAQAYNKAETDYYKSIEEKVEQRLSFPR